MAPLGMLLSTILAIGVGMLVAPLNAISQDVQHLFRFIVRAGFFVSPVMWTYEMAVERGVYGEMVLWNPMVAPITIARHGLDGKWPEMPSEWLAYTVCVTILFWIVGNIIFRKYEPEAVKHL